jgi:hypothetical protein
MRPVAQYFKFNMADSVQAWRTKWLYIKNQKSSNAQEFGLAPFDLMKEIKRLKSCDQIPNETEVEESEPLMTRILSLRSAVRKELKGVQLIAYFLHLWIQPLQARVSQIWNYSGLKDKLRICDKDWTNEIFEKRVYSLIKLTKKY